MAPRVVVHTGFMKTGTTFLQKTVFPALAEVALHSYALGLKRGGSADRRFIEMSVEVRNGVSPDSSRAIRDEMRGWMKGSNKRTHVYSWEGLVGGYLTDYRERDTMTGFLRDTFPEAHILLVIRRQDNLIESLYRQSLQTYHFSTVPQFLNRSIDGFGPFQPSGPANLDVRSLDFESLVASYERAFGADRVTVMPYEWMLNAPERFYAGLSQTLGVRVEPPVVTGIPPNRGYSILASRVAFLVNRLYRSAHNPRGLIPLKALDPRRILQDGLDRLIYVKGELIPTDWRNDILALHAKGNRALDERLGLGLKELGYYGAV